MTTPNPVPYWPPPPIDVLDRTNSTKARDQHPKDHDDLQVAVNALLQVLGTKPYGKSATLSAELLRLEAQTTGDVDGRIALLEQELDDLLHPYQSPYTSLSISGLPGTAEVGQPITGSFTASWYSGNAGNVQPASLVLRGPNGTVLASGLDPAGTLNLPINQVRTSPGSATWTISGVGVHGEGFSASVSLTWARRAYIGTSTQASLTGADVAALPGRLATSAAGTYPLAAGGFKYFAFPEDLAPAGGFTDVATQLSVSMDETGPQPVAVTNAYGISQTYRVYRTKYQLGGALTIRVG